MAERRTAAGVGLRTLTLNRDPAAPSPWRLTAHHPEPTLRRFAAGGLGRQVAEGPLRDWIAPYLDRLYGFAYTLTQNREESRDLVQECVVHALAAKRWPGDGPARRAWLFRILRNAHIDKHRKFGREIGLGPAIDSFADDVESGWRGDRRLIDVVTVRIAVTRLTDAQREIIGLIDFVGLSYGEAAGVLGVAEGTVMSRLARARKALLAVVEEENVTPLSSARSRR